MTDKEKIIKIKSLADKMYDAAFIMTTDASLLRKAMDDYHQFIISEYHKEEPVSEELEEAAKNCYFHNHAYARESFIEGANWQKEKDDKLFTIAYMDGVEKGKQQMTMDSISATIESNLDSHGADYGNQKIVCKWGELEAKRFKNGSKVKLIIIKED